MDTEVMHHPHRVQLRRTAGFRLPPGTIVVSRPSRWGNPYRVRRCADMPRWFEIEVLQPDLDPVALLFCHLPQALAEAVELHKEALLLGRLPVSVDDVIRDLRGHDLACWCALDQPSCHATTLLLLANEYR